MTKAACAELLVAEELQAPWSWSGHGASSVGQAYPVPQVISALGPAAYESEYAQLEAIPAAVERCTRALSQRECAPIPDSDHCTAAPAPAKDLCAPDLLFTGLPLEGVSCTRSLGCAPGLACHEIVFERGHCVRLGRPGDVCRQDAACEDNLVCDYSRSQCVEGVSAGGVCSFTDPAHPQIGTEATRCAVGLSCDMTTLRCTDERCSGGKYCNEDSECPKGLLCIDSRCGALREPSEVCGVDTDCTSGRCRPDDVVGGRCAAMPGEIGDGCVEVADCKSGRCFARKCAEPLEPGEECSPFLQHECGTGHCDTAFEPNVCAPGGLEGDACTYITECASGRICWAGVCRSTPFSNGVGCSADTDCESGVCELAVCRALGRKGAPCRTATAATRCDTGFYCAVNARCAAIKPLGAPCDTADECGYEACAPVDGVLRCTEASPTEVVCSGRIAGGD
jgi:hypothetical protein